LTIEDNKISVELGELHQEADDDRKVAAATNNDDEQKTWQATATATIQQ
jgi:hypothetical protein